MKNNEITVVVVNWNSGDQLKECINSLKGVYPVVVVDNNSTDNSLSAIENFEKVEIIKSKENLGFGKACNLGAKNIKSEFLLFLNPDATASPEILKRVHEFMSVPSNKDVGICGVQLLEESGHVARSCSRFPTPWRWIVHAMGLQKVVPKLGHRMAEWAHDSTRQVDQLIGAFFFVRRLIFEDLRGFDEQFFVYFEEVDFSKRAHQAGWKSVYLAQFQAFHAGGGTSNQVKARRLFYSLRSRLLYAKKHFTLLGFSITFLATMLLEPLSRSILAIARGSWSSLCETWSAYAMLCGWLPEWLAMKRGIQ